MRASFLYTIIFIIALTKTLSAQEKRIWNNSDEIHQHIRYHREHLNADSAIYFLDELINFHADEQNENHILAGYSKKIGILLLFNKQVKAFQLALTTYNKFCRESKKVKNCGSCGNIYMNLVKLTITMQDYRQGIKYIDMTCEKQKNLLFYHHKANLYRLLELPDSALMISEKGISWAKKRGDSKELIAAYNNHGLIARHLNKFDEAIAAFSTAIGIVNNMKKNIANYAYIMGNLGSCYYKIGEYSKAYEYLLIDAEGSIKQRAKGSYIHAELALAEIEELRKEHKKVIRRLKNLLDNYDKHLSATNKLAVLHNLMNTYKSIGNESEYNHYSDQWIAFNKVYFQDQIETHKTLVEQYTSNSLKQVTQKMELEKQLMDQKLIVQQKESEQKQLKNWLLIGVLLAAIMVGLLLFLRFKAIQAKKANIKDADLKLAMKEQEILALKVKEESKNVQVLSLELLTKKDFSKSLIEQLRQFDEVSGSNLKTIELFIQNELDVKSTSAQLQKQMGDLSSNFYIELKIHHPNLTEVELKLAALVVMQISNKEIAISKNTTLESAKKSKNRLKKKLSISATDNLTTYLQKFL